MMRSPKSFLKHDGGIALLEFALVFPFLFVLLFGSIEVIRLLYIQQMVEKSGYVIADVVTRYLPAANPAGAGELTEAEMNNNVFPIFGRIMNEFKDPTKQAVIVTSITDNSGKLTINWQISSPGANTSNTLNGCDTLGNCTKSIVNSAFPGVSSHSVKGTLATFDGDPTSDVKAQLNVATMVNGENMIVVETFFKYTPILQTLLQGMSQVSHINFFLSPRIYAKRTFFTPRNGPLVYLPPTFPAP